MPTTHYIWDIASDNLLMEKDGNGDTLATYTNEPREFGKLISQRRNGQTYFHHCDAQASTRTVTDENQNVVETATNSAFGETVAKTSSIINPFGFKGALGYYVNPEGGDIYVRARTLDPQLGRWLSLDPLGPRADSINGYDYVRGRPISLSDPTGTDIWIEGGGIVPILQNLHQQICVDTWRSCNPPSYIGPVCYTFALNNPCKCEGKVIRVDPKSNARIPRKKKTTCAQDLAFFSFMETMVNLTAPYDLTGHIYGWNCRIHAQIFFKRAPGTEFRWKCVEWAETRDDVGGSGGVYLVCVKWDFVPA